MKYFSPALLCLTLLLLMVGTRAGTPLPVHFTASVSPSPAHPGEAVTVQVKVAVAPGWHVYSVVPAENGPAATEIVSLSGSETLGPTTEDAPVSKFDPNFGRQVAFHERSAAFQRKFKVGAVAGQSVAVHYQTCNDKICLPPTDVILPVSYSVAAGPVREEYKSQRGDAPSSAPTGLFLFLAAALGAGLLALATPCVFPLIPITLTNFVKQANGDKKKLVRLSGGYALGIVALYLALGAIATATFGAAGVRA